MKKLGTIGTIALAIGVILVAKNIMKKNSASAQPESKPSATTSTSVNAMYGIN